MGGICKGALLMRKDFKNLSKRCQYCGKIFYRRKYTKKYEDVAIFKKRKYCNRECMRKAYINIGENNSSWSNTHTTARIINDLFLKKDKCELCGKDNGRLDIHHKDNNENNNNLDNLMCLCRSCHMKVHNPVSVCSIEGCNNRVKGHGYCDKHYQRFRRYGNPYVVRWNTRHTKHESCTDGNI
jgi:hypothetical protein